jgi:hypothetical protein
LIDIERALIISPRKEAPAHSSLEKREIERKRRYPTEKMGENGMHVES